MKGPRRQSPEEGLQRVCARFLATLPPPPDGPYWTAINPIPAKSRAAAGISKAMGMKAGVPDFLLVFQGQAYFIELKASKGSLSRPQREQIAHLDQAGAGTVVCRDFRAFVDQLKRWGMCSKRVIA